MRTGDGDGSAKCPSRATCSSSAPVTAAARLRSRRGSSPVCARDSHPGICCSISTAALIDTTPPYSGLAARSVQPDFRWFVTLPDIVLFDGLRNWLFLVEAVTSHGPMTPKRVFELREMLAACPAGLVFMSAFADFAEFRKHLRAIAWETEVWIAEIPDHLIHYNGDRFLGPR
jgi:hypothetical protein